VTDFSAMRELCGSGWLVGGDDWYDATQGSFYRCPSVDDIHRSMLEAYEQRGEREPREKARAFAEAYDADRVTAEYWAPVLEQLDREWRDRPAELKPQKA